MEIDLIVAQSQSENVLDDIKHTRVKTFKEANKIVKNSIDESIYSIIKALERNEDFINEVKKLRYEHGIPQDNNLNSWIDFQKARKEAHEKNNFKEYSTFVFKVKYESKQRLTEKFNIPMVLQDNLGFIVLGSFVWLPLKKIELVSSKLLAPIYDGEEIAILILNKVSRNELKNYIDDEYEKLEKEMDRVFKNDSLFTISERDLNIYDMREDGKQFNDISDILAEKTGDYNINEDSVKTAYHTTKKKIYSLTKKGKQKL